ncbi:MAG: L,D-transpeptidase family protein [Rhodobacteraceae bacterium]|nr:L,D-transpeptidase family protein [Paracoccaceae bacterium]
MLVLAAAVWLAFALAATAQVTAWRQAVAEAAADHPVLSEFYRERGYEPFFTGPEQGARRAALLEALEGAELHALPVARYDVDVLRGAFSGIRSERDLGRAEVLAARMMLDYASDVHGGAIRPSSIDPDMVTRRPQVDLAALLERMETEDPAAVLAALPPRGPAYVALLGARLELEEARANGGWGAPVRARSLRPGDSGPDVVALRDRLTRMGYMPRSAVAHYDTTLQMAVQAFQATHGLSDDGVAGPATIAAINVPLETRLEQVIVGLERTRWFNRPLGERHIWVNQAAFMAWVMDDGKPTLETRVVIGRTAADRRSPEFSDMMSFMEVNPRWNIPRSIAVRDYIPKMMRNPNALAAERITMRDARGQVVHPAELDLSRYSLRHFPYDMVQSPGRHNALGTVKFMFPNRFAVYLHDTPQRNHFSLDTRAYSSGCIRVEKPYELAHVLLGPQTTDPQGMFARALAQAPREVRIDLETKVPIHLTYQTAFVTPDGRLNFRDDIYGRDGRIFAALRAAGLARPGPDS